MNLVQLISTLIKIVFILGFVLGVGGALTWNDRRMSAMIQDRIGPNRAFFLLSQTLTRGAILIPAAAVAGAIAFWGIGMQLPQGSAIASQRATARVFSTLELSILITWIGLTLLTFWAVRNGPTNALERTLAVKIRDPRVVFVSGLLAHAAVVFPLAWLALA